MDLYNIRKNVRSQVIQALDTLTLDKGDSDGITFSNLFKQVRLQMTDCNPVSDLRSMVWASLDNLFDVGTLVIKNKKYYFRFYPKDGSRNSLKKYFKRKSTGEIEGEKLIKRRRISYSGTGNALRYKIIYGIKQLNDDLDLDLDTDSEDSDDDKIDRVVSLPISFSPINKKLNFDQDV